MGWHPICKSKSNQIVPRPTDKSMPKGREKKCQKEPLSKWSKSWGRAHAKASAKAELPVGCREPAGRDQGAATQASPPSPSHGPFCWKETFIFFNSSFAPSPSPTFPSSELTSLIFLFSVCPPDSLRLFEWKFLMQMCPATHFPVLCFVKYLNWPVVWVYNVYCVQTFHPISPC